MGKRHWIIVAALAATAAAIGMPAAAHTTVGVQIGVPAPVYAAPVYPQYPQAVYPQPVYVQPAPQVVYGRPAWVPAHWDGRVWVPGRYVQASGYGWRDRDHDGVPNRWDRAPRDPYRY